MSMDKTRGTVHYHWNRFFMMIKAAIYNAPVVFLWILFTLLLFVVSGGLLVASWFCLEIILKMMFSKGTAILIAIAWALVSSIWFVLAVFGGISLGMFNVYLKIYDNLVVHSSDWWLCIKRGARYAATALLYWMAVGLGLLFFIVPGFIVFVRCSLFPYYIIEHNTGPIDSLMASYRETKDIAIECYIQRIVLWLCSFLCVGLIGLIYYINGGITSNLLYTYIVHGGGSSIGIIMMFIASILSFLVWIFDPIIWHFMGAHWYRRTNPRDLI